MPHISYRYIKHFSADYIDEKQRRERRTYSMLVRNLGMAVKTDLNPLEETFAETGIMTTVLINNVKFKLLRFADAYPIIEEDIQKNKSRKLCSYTTQND